MSGDAESSAAARSKVGAIVDPETGCSLDELGMVRSVDIDGTVLRVELALAAAQHRGRDAVSDATAEALAEIGVVDRVEVRVSAMTADEEMQAVNALRDRQPRDPPYFAGGATKVGRFKRSLQQGHRSSDGGRGPSPVSVVACG